MSRRSDAEEAAHLQYETEHTDSGRAKSVVPYLAILVAVAFLLLLVAWFMQERTNQSVQGLNQSANSFRTIDQLVEDNRALHEETARLEAEVDRLQGELDQSQQARAALETQVAALEAEKAALLGPEGSPAPSPLP